MTLRLSLSFAEYTAAINAHALPEDVSALLAAARIGRIKSCTAWVLEGDAAIFKNLRRALKAARTHVAGPVFRMALTDAIQATGDMLVEDLYGMLDEQTHT